jgi:hypothetical protein
VSRAKSRLENSITSKAQNLGNSLEKTRATGSPALPEKAGQGQTAQDAKGKAEGKGETREVLA